MNLWNIKYSKERLGILQRTQAQKRHLISLIKAKSVLSTLNDTFSKQINLSLSKMSRNKSLSPQNYQIMRNNNILVKKLGNIEKLKAEKSFRTSQCKFINITKSLTNNHQNIFYISKNMKQKQIDEQNTKMFTRLIQTSPTIKRNDWIKNNIQRMRYKENMNKSRYINPDYSKEAEKLLSVKSPNKKHNINAIKNKINSLGVRPFTQNNIIRSRLEPR